MKKLLALLMACLMLVSFAACGGNTEEETTLAPEVTTEAPVAGDDVTEEATEAEDVTEEDVTEAEEETEAEEATEEDETVAEEKTEKPTSGKTEKPTQAASKKPSTTAEVVEYFNTAVNGVKTNATKVTRKYSKISLNGKTTLPSSINGILRLLGGADKFLGDQLANNSKGEEVYTGAQIKAVYPVEGESYASKLTAADVSKATCVEKDGKWVITIATVADSKSSTVKHGQGHAPKAFNVVLPGVVNDNIPGVSAGIVGLATMDYPSSTCVITVDPATGRVLNADYDLKWTINFDEAGVILPFATNDYFIINY